MPEPAASSLEDSVPLARVAQFLKHHLHDVRNELNALNLEATLMGLLATTPDASQSAERVQEMLMGCAGKLSLLSQKFSEPSPNADLTPASFIVTGWRDAQGAGKDGTTIHWGQTIPGVSIQVDTKHMTEIFRELTSNLKVHGVKEATVTVHFDEEAGEVVFQFRESTPEPVEPGTWGLEPFQNPRRGSYGLGLWRCRRLVAANHGKWSQRHDAERRELVSEMRFAGVTSDQ